MEKSEQQLFDEALDWCEKVIVPRMERGERMLQDRLELSEAEFQCFHCNEKGHWNENCSKAPALRWCDKCNKLGHVWYECTDAYHSEAYPLQSRCNVCLCGEWEIKYPCPHKKLVGLE